MNRNVVGFSLEGKPQRVLNFTSWVRRTCGPEAIDRSLLGDDVVLRTASADAASHCARNISVRFEVATVEVGMVEDVKEVEAELQPIPVMELPVSSQVAYRRTTVRAGARSTASRSHCTDLISH